MKNRIIEIRNCVGKNGKKMTQDEFASKLNLSRSFINQIEVGAKNPSDRTILDICREFNVNENWLRYGEGEMFAPRTREDDIANLTIKLLEDEPDSFRNRLVSALAKLSEDEWEVLEKISKEVVGE